MKSIVITSVLVILCIVSLGQTKVLTDEDYNTSGAIKLTFVKEVSEAKKLAQQDIDRGIPFLLIQSGIAPVLYSTDSIFENKFQVYYHEQGCTGPENRIMEAYNSVVFKFLEDKYGKKWRKSVRKDVIGFKNWKRKN